MPENHEDANVKHHVEQLSDELASDEAVFCVSEATRAAVALAFPSIAARTLVLY
jgi:hypothetical protein